MSDESQGPPPSLDRKVSTYSETDSGVDVDNEPEEGTEVGLDKRVIKPDLDIISRLCNFDEEEEEELTESEEEEEEDCSQVVREPELKRVSVTLTELSHILYALVKQHTEVQYILKSSPATLYTPLSHCPVYLTSHTSLNCLFPL